MRWRVRRYGDLAAVVPECRHNFCDMARTLRMGENTFRRPCNFKELRVVKRAHITTCALCLMAAFVPHRPNKYFHVTASNGIVSSSPYTPLAIMTASNRIGSSIRDCPRCRCRLATSATLPTPSMIERAIIMLTDHRFGGHASDPSASGMTLPSFHPLLVRPCRSPQRPTARAV